MQQRIFALLVVRECNLELGVTQTFRFGWEELRLESISQGELCSLKWCYLLEQINLEISVAWHNTSGFLVHITVQWTFSGWASCYPTLSSPSGGSLSSGPYSLFLLISRWGKGSWRECIYFSTISAQEWPTSLLFKLRVKNMPGCTGVWEKYIYTQEGRKQALVNSE